MQHKLSLFLIVLMLVSSCKTEKAQQQEEAPQQVTYPEGSFGADLAFLEQHKGVILLHSADSSAQVAIIPDYQGRVMTSTSQGMEGKSYGWLNRELIEAGEVQPQINAFGGEDRFWLGPEGGQYSIFFAPKSEFTFENWQTPPPLDTEPFQTVHKSSTEAVFQRQFTIQNYQGFTFNLKVDRTVRLLGNAQISQNLGIDLPEEIKAVGFESENTLTNQGEAGWSKEKGLLSIWILGMFNASPQTSVIIPYRNGPRVNAAYFGEVGEDRLKIMDDVMLFKGDAAYRSKIGLPPQSAVEVLGSYDADAGVLTLVKYSFSGEEDYVNSLWEYQEQPFSGDVVNAYNDGPNESGSQLGNFYELESSSSARALKSGESITHTHQTYHFEGSTAALNEIAQSVLGIGLEGVKF